MNKYRSNRLQRIAMIMSILEYSEDSYGKSISQLASFLDVPIETVRNDIYQLTSYARSTDAAAQYIELYIADEDENEITDLFNEFLYNEEKLHRYKNMICSGTFDHVRLKAQAKEPFLQQGKLSATLTSEDAKVILDFAKKNNIRLQGADKQPYYVKNDVRMSDKEIELVDKILEIKGCNEGKPIVFYYKGSTETEYEKKVVVPTFLVLNVDWGFVYLEDQTGYRYRLERMRNKNDIRLAKEGEIPASEKLPEGEKTHVRIRISEGSGFPIHSRVERDLKRMHDETKYKVSEHVKKVDDQKRGQEYYIYEDDVSDVNQLKSWVFSYGSAMVVLEPKSLRDEVIDSYQRRKAYYDSVIEQEKEEGLGGNG